MELSEEGQIILFAYYADTLDYIYEEIIKDPRFSELKIDAISSSGKTSKVEIKEVNLWIDSPGKIDIYSVLMFFLKVKTFNRLNI